MVEIIRATDKALTENIPEGFPILVDTRMQLIEPANLFLFFVGVLPGRSRSGNTLRTYAEALYDWFQCLEQNGIDWNHISANELLAYRDRMLDNPSPHTRRPFSIRTINQRIRTICRFYDWCVSRNLLVEAPFSFEEVQVTQSSRTCPLAHLDRRPGIVMANHLTLRSSETLPRAVPIVDLQKILRHLSDRDRLMAELAVCTGMRRMEIVGMTHHQIPSGYLVDETDSRLVKVKITITKGNCPRNIYLPVPLLDRLNQYIDEERHVILSQVKKAFMQRGQSYQLPSALFVTNQGKAITNTRISKNWKAACHRAGLGYDFHGLRHTFAITTLANLQRQTQRHPDMNPLKTLQVLLGHRNLATTEIYLTALQVNEAAITDSVEALYNNLLI